MKTRTENILVVLKILAVMAAIGYSIEWGAQVTSFAASFINPEWASRTYNVNLDIFNIRAQSTIYYGIAMCINILVSALKVFVWYVIYDLLTKLKIQSPFSMVVEKKLEIIAWLLLAVWLLCSVFWKTFIYYLLQDTGIHLPANNGDEYFFMAGIIYIVSQVFKRGIEMQEENQLTV